MTGTYGEVFSVLIDSILIPSNEYTIEKTDVRIVGGGRILAEEKFDTV